MKKSFTIKGLVRNLLSFLLFTGIYSSSFGQVSHAVSVTSNVFSPKDLTVQVGDTVVWTNTQGNHNVNGTQAAYPDNPESFGNDVGSGWTFSHVFTIPGFYDYRCDPHAGLGMVGTITVEEAEPAMDTLFVNFSQMTPHVGQTGWLQVVNKETGERVERSSGTIEEAFSLELDVLMSGNSYTLDIFVDFNENGYYDAPPTDHAWRYEINNTDGNEQVDVVHNTDFTDIQWEHRLGINFSGMTPHVGQMLTLYVRDSTTGEYQDTLSISQIPEAEFTMESFGIDPGTTYQLDFYADHNNNGMYDAPPTDHAWRVVAGTSMGDLEVDFVHNTDFTDIFATTGLNGEDLSSGINVYPNPASDILHIRSEWNVKGISIIGLTGSEIRTYRNLEGSEVSISLDGLNPGVYYIKVIHDDRTERVQKLIKQ